MKKWMKRLALLLATTIGVASIALLLLGSTTHAELKGTIDQQLAQYVQTAEASGFSGVVLAAQNGRTVFRQAYGWADKEQKRVNTTETYFSAGSLQKSMTAVAVLQLVGEGKLSLHEPISTYLPDYPKEVGDKITLHHLLSHSSGIPDYLVPELVTYTKAYTVNEIVDLFKNKPLLFEPGTKFDYSNSNYVLAGLLIETASHMSYEQYMQQHVFGPTGMEHSFLKRQPGMDIAIGYEKGERAEIVDDSLLYACGSLITTVDDLFRYDRAMKENKLISAEQTKLMQHGYTPISRLARIDYGYGWYVSDSFVTLNRPYVWHGGSLPGLRAGLDRIEQDDVTVIVLSNFSSDWNIGGFTREIASIVLKERFWIWQKIG
ncbi:MAG: serine hydrolase domain-containing protein [Clostridia bacterium]